MSFQEQLVKEINELRTNPKEYAKKLEKYAGYFKGKALHIPGTNVGVRTEEGAEAYKEAADFLSKAQPVPALEPSIGLGKIAKDYLEEVQKADPKDLNNITFDQFIDKYGRIEGSVNREASLGDETPEQIVTSLAASDGDTTRGHRDCLLDTNFKRIGAANGTHPVYRFCTIIFFCTKFTSKDDSNDVGFFNGSGSAPTEVKKEEGQTLKPKKVVLKQQPQEQPKQEAKDEEEDSEVVSEKRTVKIVEENGKKKKMIKVVKTLKDGSKEVEKFYQDYKEGEDDDDD